MVLKIHFICEMSVIDDFRLIIIIICAHSCLDRKKAGAIILAHWNVIKMKVALFFDLNVCI